ncbi:MAG: polyamine aminopropyltransferase [Proteobacteria bacterium]|nr:polyamine aminopropyltransferase [Pseudomonadota bacterium]
MDLPLLISAFAVATCGLIYELIAATLASYLLGDSVTQFSTVIGVYLFAMGVGSYLSKFCRGNLVATFIKVEVLLALLGGSSAALLFLLFEYAGSFRVALYTIVFVVGMLVGLEIPLLMRILKDKLKFEDVVARVLSFDYLGALVASILFPIVLAPQLGLVRTSFLFGILNCFVGLWVAALFREQQRFLRATKLAAVAVLGVLGAGFIFAGELVAYAEAGMYHEPIIYAKQTPYQRIVLTRSADDTRLYLNNSLQFSSRDEYRYHEALVHPGLAALPSPKRVLILGGGDGMAAREALRYESVQEVVLVDLDAAMTELFKGSSLTSELNQHSLTSPKLQVVNTDAFEWVRNYSGAPFDFVVIDFPDPTHYSIGKLYTTRFYTALRKSMSPGALGVVQSTSPLLARKSFWCVGNTLTATGFETLPYHLYVASFGEWGYHLFGEKLPSLSAKYPEGLRYVSAATVESMRFFPPDMGWIETEVNRLNNQALVQYYESEWSKYTS